MWLEFDRPTDVDRSVIVKHTSSTMGQGSSTTYTLLHIPAGTTTISLGSEYVNIREEYGYVYNSHSENISIASR